MNKAYGVFDILGVKISSITIKDACSFVQDSIASRAKGYICVCPVSTILACQKDKNVLTSVNHASLATPDGMPVVWLGRAKGHGNVRRVYGPDLMLELFRVSEEKGYRNYFFGSSEQVIDRLQKRIKSLFPRLIISGAYSPPFGEMPETETKKNIQLINDSNSDILWVALGSPKQDIWMHEHRDRINAPVMIGVGAAFDFIAGTKKQAPRFLQKAGLEWLFRLIMEPGRLWKRYLIGNPLFLFLLCKEFIRSGLNKEGEN